MLHTLEIRAGRIREFICIFYRFSINIASIIFKQQQLKGMVDDSYDV